MDAVERRQPSAKDPPECRRRTPARGRRHGSPRRRSEPPGGACGRRRSARGLPLGLAHAHLQGPRHDTSGAGSAPRRGRGRAERDHRDRDGHQADQVGQDHRDAGREDVSSVSTSAVQRLMTSPMRHPIEIARRQPLQCANSRIRRRCSTPCGHRGGQIAVAQSVIAWIAAIRGAKIEERQATEGRQHADGQVTIHDVANDERRARARPGPRPATTRSPPRPREPRRCATASRRPVSTAARAEATRARAAVRPLIVAPLPPDRRLGAPLRPVDARVQAARAATSSACVPVSAISVAPARPPMSACGKAARRCEHSTIVTRSSGRLLRTERVHGARP